MQILAIDYEVSEAEILSYVKDCSINYDLIVYCGNTRPKNKNISQIPIEWLTLSSISEDLPYQISEEAVVHAEIFARKYLQGTSGIIVQRLLKNYAPDLTAKYFVYPLQNHLKIINKLLFLNKTYKAQISLLSHNYNYFKNKVSFQPQPKVKDVVISESSPESLKSHLFFLANLWIRKAKGFLHQPAHTPKSLPSLGLFFPLHSRPYWANFNLAQDPFHIFNNTPFTLLTTPKISDTLKKGLVKQRIPWLTLSAPTVISTELSLWNLSSFSRSLLSVFSPIEVAFLKYVLREYLTFKHSLSQNHFTQIISWETFFDPKHIIMAAVCQEFSIRFSMLQTIYSFVGHQGKLQKAEVFAFCRYDDLYCWDKATKDYFLLNNGRFKKIFILGNIWISTLEKWQAYVQKKGKKTLISKIASQSKSYKAVVVAFDEIIATEGGIRGSNTCDLGIQFLKDLWSLSQEFPDVLFLLKPKYDLKKLDASKINPDQEIQLKEVVSQLQDQSNVSLIDHRVDAHLLLVLADVSVHSYYPTTFFTAQTTDLNALLHIPQEQQPWVKGLSTKEYSHTYPQLKRNLVKSLSKPHQLNFNKPEFNLPQKLINQLMNSNA